MYKKLSLLFLFFILAMSLFPSRSSAQPPEQAAPKPAPKRTEATYSADFDHVWDNVIAVLMELGLSEHPHGKMSINKESGKITTPVFRYFKISSAKPVQEKDYQDSYIITVDGEQKTKTKKKKVNAAKPVKVQIQRKFEIYDNTKKGWAQVDPATENVGLTEAALFNALDSKMATAASEGSNPNAAPPNLIKTPPLFTNEESKPG